MHTVQFQFLRFISWRITWWLCYLYKWWWWWRWGRWLEISRWKRLTSVWRCCWRLQDDGISNNNDDTVDDDDDDDDWIHVEERWQTYGAVVDVVDVPHCLVSSLIGQRLPTKLASASSSSSTPLWSLSTFVMVMLTVMMRSQSSFRHFDYFEG